MDTCNKKIQSLIVQIDLLKNELFELEKLYRGKELEYLIEKNIKKQGAIN